MKNCESDIMKMDGVSRLKKLINKEHENDDLYSEVSSQTIDLNKEYGLLAHYDNYSVKNRMANVYAFISSALEARQENLLDLKEIQLDVEQHFKYLFLIKRFNKIRTIAPVSIQYDYDGFHIVDSTFETLDEVEKAMINKAFL